MTLPGATYLWWAGLCVVSLVNVAIWLRTARWLALRTHPSPQEASWRKLQLILAAGYVLGCAYRSVLPVFDVPRQTLFDTQFSSALIGRSVATVAELCFAAQWALLLQATGRALARPTLVLIARHILPLIVFAELCSWYSVLTTSNLGHVFEESLWAVCAALVTACLVTSWSRTSWRERPVLALGCALAAVYTAYLVLVDVPMYWARWVSDEASGRAYLGLAEGVVDAWSRWTATDHWDSWRTEVVWMSLYFSVGVWMSLGLVAMPMLQPAAVRLPSPGPANGRPAWRKRSAVSMLPADPGGRP